MDNESRLIELLCDDGEQEDIYLLVDLIEQNRYIIRDIYWNFFTPGNPLGLGLNDIVEAQPNEDGYLSVTNIIAKSGYTTLRLMATTKSTVVTVDHRGEDAIKFFDYLQEMGCTSTVTMASFWLVHIPPNCQFQQILDYIQAEAIPLQHYVDDSCEDWPETSQDI
ncbi:DUF4265 domain-containing protein [Acaryochloris sp. IP29b_bin.148]|uniref:DUF4265 domain-containing protein n=1 Tax=Acaryochloris sp. IP29b_bin.148 TaxID=2969218 RepID=UPI00260D8F5E|nr:DUF4265 domain-containing protein [Acaryochloris sp. IP29b_bin.148]